MNAVWMKWKVKKENYLVITIHLISSERVCGVRRVCRVRGYAEWEGYVEWVYAMGTAWTVVTEGMNSTWSRGHQRDVAGERVQSAFSGVRVQSRAQRAQLRGDATHTRALHHTDGLHSPSTSTHSAHSPTAAEQTKWTCRSRWWIITHKGPRYLLNYLNT